MKAPLIIFLILFIIGNASLKAQSKSQMPKWISGKGYWVVQSSLKTPKTSTIYFYTTQHELVYKELITGKKINIEKNKTRKLLAEVLDQAVTAWQKEGLVRENQQLVITKP